MGGDIDQLTRSDAARLLAWWMESGVDTPVQEDPRNWLEQPPQAQAPSQTSTAPAAPPAQVAKVAKPIELPDTLELFQGWMKESADLPLASAGARRVLPKGREASPLMILTDAPTREDAEAGQTIGGDSWTLAQAMLRAIGIDPDAAYYAPLTCFHAPGARLSEADLGACGNIARRHVALVKPGRLLLLGEGPARSLLGKSVAEARGHAHSIEGVRAVATFHPRFLMKTPSAKALAWQDLLLLMEQDA